MSADKRLENAAERCRKAANSYYNRGLVRARERDLHLNQLQGLLFYENLSIFSVPSV